MTRSMKRSLTALAMGAVVVPLFVASFAYACTSLATLSLSPAQGTAGATVSGTGKNFVPHGADRPSTEPVVVRFNSRTGPVLWSGRPDAAGNIAFSFVVPEGENGVYTIIATQNDASGNPASGTPARASFTVTGLPEVVDTATVAPVEETATPAPAVAPTPVPVAPAPVNTGAAPATRRVAPARSAAPAPVPVAVPAPVAAPAPVAVAEAVPAPVATPPSPAVDAATETVPVTASARRSVVSSNPSSSGSPVLAIALVGFGLALALGASAFALAGRRHRDAPARARRP